MNANNEHLDPLIEKAIDYVNRRTLVDLSTDEARNRIEVELKPVLEQLKALMQEVAESIAMNNDNKKALIKKLETTFFVYGCPISFDENDEYTHSDNLASIKFIDDKLQLKVNKSLRDSENSQINNEYLEELIHELGAFLLIKQAKGENQKIRSNDELAWLKRSLMIGETRIYLTHIIDAILKSLIKSYSQNSN